MTDFTDADSQWTDGVETHGHYWVVHRFLGGMFTGELRETLLGADWELEGEGDKMSPTRARRLADDFNDYNILKGYGYRAEAISCKEQTT